MSLTSWRKDRLEENNIDYLFNFSRIGNLSSIIEKGILSKNFVSTKGIPALSFAEKTVQNRRHVKTVELSDHSKFNIHDLVPLYFVTKNPALSKIRNIQDNIFIIVISPAVIYDEDNNFTFTDGNAASGATKFYQNLKDLKFLPFDVINAERWDDLEDGRRKRCSEFLVYPKVDTKYILHFAVINHEAFSECSKILKASNCKIPICINNKLFF